MGPFIQFELDFKVTAEVDLTMGFDVKFPSDSNFVINPLTGQIVSMEVYVLLLNELFFNFIAS